MGQEINSSRFTAQDFSRFQRQLGEETVALERCFVEQRLEETGGVGGFELEAWLIDAQGRPAPINAAFLKQVNDAKVVPELAAFNVELNTAPQPLHGNALAVMEADLAHTWSVCQSTAADLDARLTMIGILPSVTQAELSLRNMSGLARYRALNEQVFLLRNGQPLQLHIEGRETLSLTHHDVMLEAGTTSLQLHLQVPASRAHRYLNAAQIAAAPMVAVGANSPYLFGHDLWAETRVPLFEQAVQVGSPGQRRVTFGRNYCRESVFDCFRENLETYPVLVPADMRDETQAFAHLRFHNGTIWRWNRPLIGTEQTPAHVRIEHRVVAAGPSVVDCLANAALFFGLMSAWLEQEQPVENQLDFATARANFYACARDGFDARVSWQAGKTASVQELILEDLLPQARTGLEQLGIDTDDIERYLGIIRSRTDSGQNGAVWQRRWVEQHGRDMQQLTLAYLACQESGDPVHAWRF